MFCTNCGKDNPDNAAHCTGCGSALNSAATPATPVAKKDNPLKKYLTPKFIGIAAGVLVVIIVGICIIVANAGKINLKDYMISQEDFVDDELVTGINGRGVANANDFFDFEEFNELIDIDEEDILKDIEDIKDMDDVADMMEDIAGKGKLDYPIEVELDKSKELKNGDVIKVTLKVDKDELKEEYDIKTRGKEEMVFEYTVSGLQEATILDPFQFIDVEFGGINSDYYADLKLLDEESKTIGKLTFEVSWNNVIVYDEELNRVTSLSYEVIEADGKTNVKCSYNEEDLAEHLFLIDETTKEYEVPDLGDYATKASDISAEDLKALKVRADELLADRIYTDEEGKFNFNTCYFCLAENAEDPSYDHNKLFFTYYYDRVTEYTYIEDDIDCCIIACMIEDIVIQDGKIKNIDDVYMSYGRDNATYDALEEYTEQFTEEETITIE